MSYFQSNAVASRVAFALSGNYGKAATRIQRLANPPKGSHATGAHETKEELRECLSLLAWGIDNVGEFMRDPSECIAEWCGGGYTKPATDSDIEQIANALHISKADAHITADANRLNRTSYLTIRRNGLAPIMEAKIQDLLGRLEGGTEPSTTIIERACSDAFQQAIMWGNWAEATLIRDDMLTHTGKAPEMPGLDKASIEKANRIKEELNRRQMEQATRDAEALAHFDLNELAA